MATINDILAEFRAAAESKRHLGDRFERLMQAYFRTDPYYQDLFSDVWLWWEYPQRGNSGDIGIDLVAKERISGELWAIQCKFYHPEHTLSKSDVDSFLAASGKAEFSHRLLVSTIDRWSENLNKTLDNQKVPVHRLTVHDLANSPIDWEQFSSDTIPTGSQRLQDAKGSYSLKRLPRKELRPHQQIAVDNVIAGLQTADRGKLIMACGTGKTFTALKIAERMVGKGGRVLFLVPSISLLSQSLREWTAEAEIPLHPIAVCSDVKVGRRTDSEDLKASDLPFPATTDSEKIRKGAAAATNKMTVIFSTYQSIESITAAQKAGLPPFDLIICDEAHRTTGVILSSQEESQFTRVHRQEHVQGKKRLYMTATPRLYGDRAKSKALEENITLCSMDEEAIYGKELHRLGFGEAVRAHDDRFNAIVNKLALNQQRPPQIDVIGIGGGREDSEEIDNDLTPVQLAFHWPELEEWKEALYAKVVHKVWRSPVLGGLGQGCGHHCRSPSHAHGGHHRQKSQR
ncbi:MULTISPECIES: DEAD/DEAH box helicase family protein [unclassified Thermosynechococcus]|uniref:restriction endonuclease n=1 Tax=unclassified Thermosynechococcus TaxID=2622553 RepID=UPI0026710FCD|nr:MULTISPECIES: DEAD/DEAH box helicase family protein [unclassified Thermosynechococcus]WKT82899.1 DEAD/DEAH box helicase family protein [Thermosynechococcus sp. HY596]WNC62026.1 DEAD/DEAH box helicase family protein [Thermosynechococcus sp. HY591]WNC64579.1 DEAD/DEAH box helicase family protein [Thermosynechococcus sp. HY593]